MDRRRQAPTWSWLVRYPPWRVLLAKALHIPHPAQLLLYTRIKEEELPPSALAPSRFGLPPPRTSQDGPD
jgi:hypothetical protein